MNCLSELSGNRKCWNLSLIHIFGCVQICLLSGVLHSNRGNEGSGCRDTARVNKGTRACDRSNEECIPERVRQNRKKSEMYFESNRRRLVGTPDGGTIPERDEEF